MCFLPPLDRCGEFWYNERVRITLNGTQIVAETWGEHTLIYLYDDATGEPIGLKYRNTSNNDDYHCFFFEKNIFGDVVAIYDENGVKIGSYAYNAWGSASITIPTEVYGTTAYKILTQYNPFRYRGYYCDIDSGLYYLQSRYYHPTWGRFISADSYVSTGQGMLGYNMYAYCGNNPVMCVDGSGESCALVVALVVASIVYKQVQTKTQQNNYKNNQEQEIPSGYIDNQNMYPNIHMGLYGADWNGCGWIAIYNAMIMLGKPQNAADIIRYFDRLGNTFLLGTFGATPVAVTRYLTQTGFMVMHNKIIGIIPHTVDIVAKNATANILLYAHDSGAHYVAYQWDGNQFVVYNDYVKTFTSLEEYMEQVGGTPLMVWHIGYRGR